VVGEGLLKGRQEVFRLDLVEGRRLMRRFPALQKRVLLRSWKHRGLQDFYHREYIRLVGLNLGVSLAREAAFLGLLRLIERHFSERLPPKTRTNPCPHKPPKPPPARSPGQ